jgi:hypothetical protein
VKFVLRLQSPPAHPVSGSLAVGLGTPGSKEEESIRKHQEHGAGKDWV